MHITFETKIRFARMLAKRQIIVFRCKKNVHNRNFEFKFIGADDGARYDFTPMVADTLGLPIDENILYCSVKGNDAAEIVRMTIQKLAEDEIISEEKSGYDLYEEIRGLLTTFSL